MLQKSMFRLLSIADLISITNAILGFLAIIMLFLNEIHYSFSFILLSTEFWRHLLYEFWKMASFVDPK